jgi:hypothetical protein
VYPVDVARVDRAALVQPGELIPIPLPRGVTSDFEVVAHGDDLVGLVAHGLDNAPQQRPLNSHERRPGRSVPREGV